MKMKTHFKNVIFFLFLICINSQVFAQNVDSLFNIAREKAFNEERNEARMLCDEILKIKPTYLDAAILKGRTYAWDKMYDSAIIAFQYVFKQKIGHKDGISAITDALLWSKNYKKALKFSNIGISFHPTHEDFYIKKATILIKLEEKDKAKKVLLQVLELNQTNEKVIEMLKSLDQKGMMSKIVITHDFEFFKEPYYRRRHLTSLAYSRKTNYGSIIGRLNTNDIVKNGEFLFGDEVGQQLEIDAYPKLMKGTYAYVSYGYGFNRLFPKHRAGLELFKGLPKSFETSFGFRYMQFISSLDNSKKNIVVYTGSIGKYYKNLWFSFRPFITPKSTGVSQSFFITTRKYLSTGDEYIFAMIGTGSSPDEVSGDLTDYELYKLNKRKVKLGYQKPFQERWLLKSAIGYEYSEYKKEIFRHQWNVNIGLNFKF